MPSRPGSSQASALTATTTSGGKDRGSSSSGALFEARKALFEEAFAPLRDDLPSGSEPTPDDAWALRLATAQMCFQASVSTPRRIWAISWKCSGPQMSGGESWITGSPRSSVRQMRPAS